jgi:hypothetical protein
VSGTGPEGSADFPGFGESEDSLGAAEAEGAVAGFRATRRGVTARFDAPQAGIIRTLVSQVAELVGGDMPDVGLAGSAQPGGDLLGGDLAGGDRPGGHRPSSDIPPGGDRPGGGIPPGGPAARSGDDPLSGHWDSPEEFAALLGLSESTALPEDPVLARLLPDAYRDDAEAAGDFRRYTEQDLRSGKVAAARTVLATLPEGGGQVRLSTDDAQAWLRAINDVRLALGVRLSITEDFEERLAGLDPEDPRSAYFWVYDWLTYLQETLVHALW